MKDYKVIADIKKGATFYASIIGGLGFCVISGYLFYSGLSDTYPQIFLIGFGTIFGIIGLFCLYVVSTIDRLEVYKHKLVIKSILGYTKKTIDLNEIIAWSETEKKNSDNAIWKELTIYTEKRKFKILSSYFYRNYPQLKEKLVRGKQKYLQNPINRKKTNKLLIGVLFVISCICLFCSYISFKNSNSILSTQNVTTLHQIVTNKIEIDKPARGGHSIKLSLKEYPNFDFEINGIAYSATYADNLVSNVKVGDTLFVDIKTDEYKKKLTKEKALEFFDKTINYRFIRVYGLRDKKQSYLTLSDYNKESETDGPLVSWFFLLFGLGLLPYSFYKTRKQKKKPDA